MGTWVSKENPRRRAEQDLDVVRTSNRAGNSRVRRPVYPTNRYRQTRAQRRSGRRPRALQALRRAYLAQDNVRFRRSLTWSRSSFILFFFLTPRTSHPGLSSRLSCLSWARCLHGDCAGARCYRPSSVSRFAFITIPIAEAKTSREFRPRDLVHLSYERRSAHDDEGVRSLLSSFSTAEISRT